MRKIRPATDERGSASAELVLLVPLLSAVLGLFIVGGILWFDHQILNEAARNAVDAATTTSSSQQAADVMRRVARDDVAGSLLRCTSLSTSTAGTSFEAGGRLSVSISCRALLPRLPFVPLPSHIVITSRKSAVLEPYRLLAP